MVMSLKDPKNKKIFNDFIAEHAPLIGRTLNRLKSSGKIPSHIEDEDLHFAGIHGLVDAMHKYDHDVASRTAKDGENVFAKYAEKRIMGKMLDHAVSQDPVPRALRQRSKNIASMEQAPAPQPEAPEQQATEAPEEPKV